MCDDLGFIERLLERELERSRRYGKPLSLITFDLDDFNCIKDAFGHKARASVLDDISRRG